MLTDSDLINIRQMGYRLYNYFNKNKKMLINPKSVQNTI